MAEDLLTAVQDAVFSRLSAAGLPAPVFQHVPDGTQPPMIIIGDVGSEPGDGKDDEVVSFDIEFLWRGAGRRPLLAMMHAARSVLDGSGPYFAPDLELAGLDPVSARWAGSDTAEAEDGKTYAGIQRYAALVEPA